MISEVDGILHFGEGRVRGEKGEGGEKRGGGERGRERKGRGRKGEGEKGKGRGRGRGKREGGRLHHFCSEFLMHKLSQEYAYTVITWFGYFGNHSGEVGRYHVNDS